jgi:arylsulfatase A-like enzyme/tetratricopeptide (TPR) repeat protein
MRIEKRAGIAAVAASAVVAVALAGWWLLRPPADPAAVVRGLWAANAVERPNVVLVTLDTVRADHLGCYGHPRSTSPNVDALAGRGVLFSQAATVAPLTLPAHASMLTGMYPTHHGVRVNGNTAVGQSQRTLAEVLHDRGYATGAFIAGFVLDGRWGLNQGFDVYDDRFDLNRYEHVDLGSVQRPGNVVMDAALAWLAAHEQGSFFAWIHLYDAHAPYEPPEPFASQYAGLGLAGLYDGEIAFADAQVGRCVSWLRENGLDRKTVVVVVGDHGEGLGSHGEGNHGYFVYDYALRVPLVVATPLAALQGVRVESQVSIVDVFPTVLALAGFDVPGTVHGRSLVPAMLGRPLAEGYAYAESMTPSLQFGWSPLQTLRTSRYKLIQAPRPELYDLSVDPGEQTNVAARQPLVLEELAARLDRLVAETSRDAPEPATADLDMDTVERLAALGYIGAPTRSGAAATKGPLADPKDKLRVFSIVQQAGELISRSEHRDAARILEDALREDPKMPQARLMLAGSYAELERTREAREQFDVVLREDPTSVQALVGVASLLMREGRGDDVIALCERTLSLDPRNMQAHAFIGEVHAGRGRPAEALPHFEEAVAIQPKLTRNRLNLASSLIELAQYARAQELLEAIVADTPRFPLARYNLGLLYEEQGRLAEARAAYAAEVAAYPQQFKARFNLGKVLFALGDRAGAVEQMREVTRVAPRQPEGYLFLARGLLQQGATPEEIQPLVEKGLSLARADDLKALAWFLMADVFSRKQQPEKVSEALRRANGYASGGGSGGLDARRH